MNRNHAGLSLTVALIGIIITGGFLLVYPPCDAAADESVVEVTASADNNAPKIGDVITYRVRVTCPRHTKVRVPKAEAKLKPFEVRDFSTKKSRNKDGRKQVIVTWKLQIFSLGKKPISGLNVEYTLPDSEEAETTPVPTTNITVGSVLKKGTKGIKDIRDPVPIHIRRSQWLMAALLAIGGIGIVALIAWLIIRYLRSRPSDETQRELVQAHQRAIRRLDSLQRSGLAERAELKPFYERLSAIMREYVEARFDVTAMQETTSMLEMRLGNQQLDAGWLPDLIELLREADMVKFARRPADTAMAKSAMEKARSIIDRSAPRTETAEQPSAGASPATEASS